MIVTIVDRVGSARLLAGRIVLGVLVLAAMVVDSRVWSTPTTYALATVTALWLASLVTDVGTSWGRKVLAPTSWAAEWSYSLYATHLPVLALLAAVTVPNVGERWALTPLTALGCVALTTVPMGAAFLLYWLFERNTNTVRRALDRQKGRTESVPAPAEQL